MKWLLEHGHNLDMGVFEWIDHESETGREKVVLLQEVYEKCKSPYGGLNDKHIIQALWCTKNAGVCVVLATSSDDKIKEKSAWSWGVKGRLNQDRAGVEGGGCFWPNTWENTNPFEVPGWLWPIWGEVETEGDQHVSEERQEICVDKRRESFLKTMLQLRSTETADMKKALESEKQIRSEETKKCTEHQAELVSMLRICTKEHEKTSRTALSSEFQIETLLRTISVNEDTNYQTIEAMEIQEKHLESELDQLLILLCSVGIGLMVFGVVLIVLYWILGWNAMLQRMEGEGTWLPEGRPRSRRIRRLPSMPSIKEEPRGQEQDKIELVHDPQVNFNLSRGTWPPEAFDMLMENSAAVDGVMMNDVLDEMVTEGSDGVDVSIEGFAVTDHNE